MSGDLYPVAGCRIFIGLPIALKSIDYVQADFSAVDSPNWKEIDGWSQMGAIGDSAALITSSLINRGRDIKQKGTANAGSMANVFAVIRSDVGQTALRYAARGRNKTNYEFRIDLNDFEELSSAVTITIADPGVISWAAHTLQDGDKVSFETTGDLPTGLTAGTEYFVVDSGAGVFSVALTDGGAAIETTGTQSGTHTAFATTQPSRLMFAAVAMGAQEQGGEANSIRNLNATLEINSNIVDVDNDA